MITTKEEFENDIQSYNIKTRAHPLSVVKNIFPRFNGTLQDSLQWANIIIATDDTSSILEALMMNKQKIVIIDDCFSPQNCTIQNQGVSHISTQKDIRELIKSHREERAGTVQYCQQKPFLIDKKLSRWKEEIKLYLSDNDD